MHKISIPEATRNVLKNRLGRERKYARLDPRKTALLVIDMQNAFLLPGMQMEMPSGRDIIPNINRIAAAVRAAGGIVVWIQCDFSAERSSWSTWFDHHMSPATRDEMIKNLSPGNIGYELHASLQTHAEDLVVPKKRFSCFVQGSSDLHVLLSKKSIDTVVITGTVTNTCCETTARDAMQMNYKTIFMSDANAARTDGEHNATLISMLQTFAEVLDTDELLGALKTSDPLRT